MPDTLAPIAEAQLSRWRSHRAVEPPGVLAALLTADNPATLREALADERDQSQAWVGAGPVGADPVALRAEAAAAGTLHATEEELAYRELFPTLDLGVYCAHHAMGKPSLAVAVAVEQHLGELAVHGIGVWPLAGWVELLDVAASLVSELVGDKDGRGEVAFYPNLSEALSAALRLPGGRLLTTEGHFTTAHYIHEAWAARTGGAVDRLPIHPDGTLPTEALIAALRPDTTIVSLTTAFYRTGFMHELHALCEAMHRVCPDAALILDAYQTLGTVNIPMSALPKRSAVLGGGVKQLHAGTGGGFGWFSAEFLAILEADRTGWWAHAEPLAFDHGPFRPGPGAQRLRAGVPSTVPLVALIAELRVLATLGGGALHMGVARARARTRRQVAEGIARAQARGLTVLGGDSLDRRAAFFAVQVNDGGAAATRLGDAGITVDFRNDSPGSTSGVVRLSASAASFGYEVAFAVDRLADALASR